MKKKTKIVVSVLICIALIICSLAAAYFISGANAPKKANSYRTVLANTSEFVSRVASQLIRNNDFDKYTALTEIPETDNGYVPQGFCVCEKLGAYIISYYHSEKPSVIALVDIDSRERVKTLSLTEESGADFKGHAGGLADGENYLFISDGRSIRAVSLAEISAAKDMDSITLKSRFQTDVKCSYLNSDGEFLYAGEFYTFEFDNAYSTDKSHHIMMSVSEVSFARCNAYSLSEIEKWFAGSADGTFLPQFSLAVPNRVQGITRLPDGSFALSTSYGRKNNSYLKIYSDVTKTESNFSYESNGIEIPVFMLSESSMIKQYELPPMLEGIDCKDGVVTGIFESGAQRYSNAAFLENSICEFK